MRLHGGDVWGHFAPLFHLVDVFAVYAITLVGGRHIITPTFTPLGALLAIGEMPRLGLETSLNLNGTFPSFPACMTLVTRS